MSSYFSLFANSVTGYFYNNQPLKRPFQYNFQGDRAASIYHAINWKTSVIGGSYALHQFHSQLNQQTNKWEPDDIDIMVGSNTPEEFHKEATEFENKCPEAELVKWSRRTEYNETEFHDVKTNQTEIRTYADMIDNLGDAEIFHDTVHGSRTYHHPTAGKVQLVDIRTEPDRDLLTTLTINTDTPACVSYTVAHYKARTDREYNAYGKEVNTKIWHFPDKGREILLTGKGPVSDICPNRKTKYEERGYTFYE